MPIPQNTILLVDDDSDLLSLLSLRLSSAGYLVRQATSAEEALAILPVIRPDLVITDLRMDGFRISLTYGWHKIVEGQKRLKSEE